MLERCSLISSLFAQVRRGTFDYFSVLSDVTIEDGAVPVDFCRAKEHGISDVYLTDLTGSLQTSTSRGFNTPLTIISDDSLALSFLPSDRCILFANQCIAYCEDTCLRTVTYKVDPTGSKSFRLRVYNNDKTCIDVDNTYWYEEEDTDIETLLQNSRTDRLRYFSVTLPKGSYTVQVIDRSGQAVWPTFVEETYEDALCPNALDEGAVDLLIPAVRESDCESLVRNGDAEASDTNHTILASSQWRYLNRSRTRHRWQQCLWPIGKHKFRLRCDCTVS